MVSAVDLQPTAPLLAIADRDARLVTPRKRSARADAGPGRIGSRRDVRISRRERLLHRPSIGEYVMRGDDRGGRRAENEQ